MKKFGVVLFIIGIYLLFTIISDSKASYVKYPRDFLFKSFGMLYILIPITFIHISIKRRKSRLTRSILVLRWVWFYMFSLPLIQLIGKEIYGYEKTGGVIGNRVLEILQASFGIWGSFILLVCVGIWFFLHIYNKSFYETMSNIITYIYERIKKDIEEFRSFKLPKKATFPIDLRNPVQNKEVVKTSKNVNEEITLKKSGLKKTELKQEQVSVKKFELENKEYSYPELDLLDDYEVDSEVENVDYIANKLLSTLESHGISLKLKDVERGPQFTRFDLEVPPGLKVSQVYQLSNEIALALKASKIRITAVPAKEAIGIEVPNEKVSIVGLKQVILDVIKSKKSLEVAAGVDVLGKPYTFDISEQPHVLIAGATGSGKSILMHSLLITLLFKNPPNRLKVILIDPKKIEFPQYNGIPHLFDPITEPQNAACIVDPQHALRTLNALIDVMEERYELFSAKKVRDISTYNEKYVDMFYIVVFVDELADLVLQTRRAVEDCIQRLSQLSRAVGIHLIISTQRPSVDVITGVIKANLPARIALKCSSQVDSRVIIDTQGAELLQGKGDMLFISMGSSTPIRLQAPYISQREISRVVEYLKKQGMPNYVITDRIRKKYMQSKVKDSSKLVELYTSKGVEVDEERISLIIRAFKLMKERKRVSHDLLKAEFGASSTASDILSLLEIGGFIYKEQGSNKWEIDYVQISNFI
ncbi:MAG: DNA translocase FtsK [bacterium]|nr:DNA translocase FtsK [bacterium]